MAIVAEAILWMPVCFVWVRQQTCSVPYGDSADTVSLSWQCALAKNHTSGFKENVCFLCCDDFQQVRERTLIQEEI